MTFWELFVMQANGVRWTGPMESWSRRSFEFYANFGTVHFRWLMEKWLFLDFFVPNLVWSIFISIFLSIFKSNFQKGFLAKNLIFSEKISWYCGTMSIARFKVDNGNRFPSQIGAFSFVHFSQQISNDPSKVRWMHPIPNASTSMSTQINCCALGFHLWI